MAHGASSQSGLTQPASAGSLARTFGLTTCAAARLWPRLASLVFCAYNPRVRITFDPVKNERNLRLRGLNFERASDFSFDTAVFAVDDRKEYPETRYVALGLLGDRVHVLCFAETNDGIRVISFRKANPREVKRYAQARPTDSP